MAMAVVVVLVAGGAARGQMAGDPRFEQIDKLAERKTITGEGIILRKTEGISTRELFKPPVEITIVAKTDSTNLRIGYAADQVIFNWENNPTELRVDGGPAKGKHKPGAGGIPKNTFVTIRWLVQPTQQQIFVDGQLRYEHAGNYSRINNPVTVCSNKSRVAVKSILVRKLTDAGK